MSSKIRVVELFAGVGGFRLGLETSSERFETIWANQWEPNRQVQHAFDCYVAHFGNTPNHTNEDISIVNAKIPPHDLLVGGFPCQDYSVARTGAKGIEGKKGVLWWDINDILRKKKPNYVLLENVDRLLRSPTSQRGRDFAVMLRCFYDHGYHVEWRVINSADYGFPQRRRRIFIFAYRKNSEIAKTLTYKKKKDSYQDSFLNHGFFSREFPVQMNSFNVKATSSQIGNDTFADAKEVSDKYKLWFYNSGFMKNGEIHTFETTPILEAPTTLGEIRHTEPVDKRYFLDKNVTRWRFLKGSKKIPRIKPNGEKYFYSEGTMAFPDKLDSPARTMLTSESSVNRSSHVIEDATTGNLRLLTPIECEQLNGFPKNWTNTGMPHNFRYFVMGNALVVPVVTRLGKTIAQLIK